MSDAVPDSAVTGRMLAELHTVLREYPGNLPVLAPPLNDFPHGLARIERAGHTLAGSDLRWLRDVCDRLLPQLREPDGPLRPLRGDAHAYNFITTAEVLLWNDFEDTCKGPIVWELSGMIDDEGEVAAVYPDAPDSTTLEPYRKTRRLHATVWVYALPPEVPELAAQARPMLVDLRGHV